MNPLLLKGIKAATLYIAKEFINELEITKNIKTTIKDKLFYKININNSQQHQLYKELNKYLLTNYKNKFKNLNAGIVEDAISTEDYSLAYNIEAGRILIDEGCKILVTKTKEKDTNGYLVEDFVLMTLKKDSAKLSEFLMTLLRQAKSQKKESIGINAYIYTEYWENYRYYTPMHIDRVIIPEEVKNDLINDIDRFLTKKHWYITRNLAFNRGYLIHGTPRNGKSSLIAAIARKYRRDIYYLNLNSIKSEEALMNAFRRINAGSMLIVEDIDTVWNQRETVNKKCPITFSTFINLMSGVLEKEDILIFFTTNYIDRLDSALIGDRRIDKIVRIPTPQQKEAELYLEDLYESPFKLINYQVGRSMGALFNLFEDYCDDKDKLVSFLNEEEPRTFEAEEVKLKPVFTSSSNQAQKTPNVSKRVSNTGYDILDCVDEAVPCGMVPHKDITEGQGEDLE